MKFLPILMPILCCGPVVQPPATCETACGMRFVGDFGSADLYPSHTGPWSCEILQDVERAVIARFPEAEDARFRDVCPKLNGWVVDMKEHATWKDPVYGPVAGLTDCTQGRTTIGNEPADRSSLPHEIAHVVQGCISNTCAHPGTDEQHLCWRDNGIYLAAANANLEAFQRFPAAWFGLSKDGGQ